MKTPLILAMLVTLLPSLAFAQKRTWVKVDPNAKEGTPIQIDILESNQKETRLRVRVSGFWQEDVIFAKEKFSKLTFPDPVLGGAGFPREQGAPGWWDFPPEAKQKLIPSGRFVRAMEIGTRETSIPDLLGYKGVQDLGQLQAAKVSMEGARPGTARLRGMIAIHGKSQVGKDLLVTTKPSYKEFELPFPMLPAGYSGSDEDKGPFGYLQPPIFDAAFYEKGTAIPYVGEEPEVTILSRNSFFSAAEVSIPLSAFVDARSVLVAESILITIQHLRGPIQFDCPIPWDHWIFTMPFINGNAIRESLTARGIRIESSRTARYLILTPSDYRATLDEFAKWKNSKGLAVDFAYVGSGFGDDVSANRADIDAFIENYFRKHYCHGVYVLLVGDVDVIPSGRSNRIIANPDASSADSDHVYEVLGADRLPSCYVGRLSVNSKSELQVQLDKILSYERNPVAGNWPRQVVLAANSQNDDGSYGVSSSFPSKYAGAVNAIASYGGYTNPPSFNVLHAGAVSAGATRAVNLDVIDAVDAGVGHVLYRGHGGGTSWVSGWDGSSTTGNSFDQTNDVGALSNRAYPIVYSIACQNARLRLTDSIAETWMSLANGGAVAHFGASVNSYTTENHERAKGIFRAIYESGFTRLGPALAEAERISRSVTGGGGGWDNNTFCYNLLGCPELTIRRESVSSVLRLIGTVRFEGLYRAVVFVANELGKPLEGVRVTLVYKNGDTSTATTGPDGNADFKIPEPTLVDKFTLTFRGVVEELKGKQLPRESPWVWTSLGKGFPEGTPVTVEICACSAQETELELRIPGFWKRTVLYNGEQYTQLRFPEPVVFGEGYPSLETLDAASNLVGIRGLLNEDGLLADRVPLLKKGQANWFDFPDDQNNPKLKPTKYMQNMRIGVRPALFPESAVGQKPTTVKGMLALGIDPAGARPGIPHIRGLISAAIGSVPGEEFKYEALREEMAEFHLEHPLLPAGFQGSDVGNEGYQSPELTDASFYATNKTSYRGTEKELGSVKRIGGAFGGCQLSIPMCEVTNPAELHVLSGLSCRIVHKRDFDRELSQVPWDIWTNKPSFINGAALRARLATSKIPIRSIRTARYLIVTNREFEDELADFVDWKRQKGLKVEFAFVGNDPGDDVMADRDEIDAYLENYYHANFFHGVYVLLIGDVDRIPGGRTNKVIAAPDGSNADSDHVYEVIGDDDFASLYVGRLSINNATDLTVQLDKILAYERNPALGDWPTRVSLAGNSQNDDGTYGVSSSFPSKYAAAVNAIANYTNYTNPPTFSVHHAGAASTGATRSANDDVIDALTAGRGQVLYRGHGSSTAWVSGWDGSSRTGEDFGPTQISSLDNAIHPIVYSIACQNNRIKTSDCAGEQWMSQVDGGAVAFFSASVNSYTLENHERAKGIFKAIYESGITHLGPALAEAEILSSNSYGNDQYWLSNTFCYLLLGDPEMTIRRNTLLPNFQLLTELITSVGQIEVSVLDEFSNAISGKRVNLLLTDGSVVNGLTDDLGKVILPVDASRVSKLVVLSDGGGSIHSEDIGAASGTVVSLDGSTIPENNGLGYRVGRFTTVVDGSTTSGSYALVKGTGAEDIGFFQIAGRDLLFRGRADHESKSSYAIRVRSVHAGGQADAELIISVLDDRNEDHDGDGLTELEEEERYGTDDTNPDTDGDGLGDAIEVALLGLGFDPAVNDKARIAMLEASTGFFTRKSIVTANTGQLFIEKQPGGEFLLNFQLQELDEGGGPWLDLGPPVDWLYLGTENQHFFRVEISKPK